MGITIASIDLLPTVIAKGEKPKKALFAIDSWNSHEIQGHWISFEHFVKERPLVLAVSGVVVAEGAFLLGKRSKSVTDYRGFWELVPSGSVSESTDLQEEFQRELFEESGLQAIGIPFALALDPIHQVVDLFFRVTLDEKKALTSNEEYTEFRWVHADELEAIELIPASRSILKNRILHE